jgi:S-layer protein (TIGR01564 family)
LVYGGVGVNVYDAFQDVGGNYGYASLIITKDVKGYTLGDEFTKDWKIYGVSTNAAGTALVLSDNDLTENAPVAPVKEKSLSISGGVGPLYGIALKYTGDKVDSLKDGSVVDFINNYASLEFTDDDAAPNLYAMFKMDVSKDAKLSIGQKTTVLNADIKLKDIAASAQQSVVLKAPITKLDTEASLDSDKNLILVGGPVVNALTKELQDAGKVSIDNSSPATLAVVDDKILVVAGGDRDKTREAALELIENY